MDTRQLKTLLAIHSHGTFAQAAGVVGLTPSAVSQQMQALENELRVTIFNRNTRPPLPTPQGMQVIEMAQDILRREEDARASLRGDMISGTFLFGSVRTSALNLLPRALVQMRQRYPTLKPSLRIALSSPLIADVAAGRLDAAIVAEHLGFPNALRWSPFLKEPLWLIAPDTVSERDPIALLKSQPYIRFRSGVPLANLIDTEISRLGVITKDVAEIDTIGSIVTCVRQGLGISVVPHVALELPEGANIVRLPFGDPQVTRQIGIVERTVSARGKIIARIHTVLSDLCGQFGIARHEEGD